MKLRHLLLASFAACTFASCSDDSSNGIEIPEENYQMIDANVSLTATALDGIQTKGATKEGGDAVLESGSNNEQFINELTAYLFYVDNGENEDAYKFAAMKTVSSTDGNSVKTIEDIVVKVKATAAGELSDTQLAVVFLANTKLATPPSNLGDVKTAELEDLVDFTHVHPAPGVTQTYVPMFSQIVTIGGGTENGKKLLAGTEYDNWVTAVASPTVVYTKNTEIGKEHKKVTSSGGSVWTEGGGTYNPNETPDADKIPLTRHVARVQLQAIDCDFKNNYADASFELTHVYIANASNTSLIYADAKPYSLDNATTYSHGCSYKRDDYFLVNGSENIPSLHWTMDAGVDIAMTGNDHSKNISNGNINYDGTYWFKFDDQTIEGDEGDPSNRHKEMPQFYVFEMRGNKQMFADDPNNGDSLSGMIQTMLILRGNWYPNGKTEGLGNDVVKSDRYYRIPIKQDATSGIIGVQRNTIYKIYATITGEGSKDPDTSELNACISFSIKVEPWTVITQTETDVN